MCRVHVRVLVHLHVFAFFFGRSAYLHYLKVNHIFAQRATLLYTIFFSLLFFVGFSICQSEVVVILYHSNIK